MKRREGGRALKRGGQRPTSVASDAAEAFDMTPLTRLFGFKIGMAYLRARRLFKRRFAELQLTTLDFSVLSLLAHQKVHQARLSLALSVPAQNLTAVLERLEGRGLVLRARSDSDRRAQIVLLSDAGRALLADANRVIEAVERDLVQRLTPGEQGMFGELLAKLCSPTAPDEAAPLEDREAAALLVGKAPSRPAKPGRRS
jgi:DNA-binding MarR family transcriptional regulator